MGTSVKTGNPPQFKAATDLSTLIPGVGSSVGIEDIGKAIDFYKAHRAVFAAIIGFLGGIFGHKKAAAPAASSSTSSTSSSSSTSPTTGGTAPTGGSPGPDTRRVASLRSRYMLIERKNNLGQSGGGRYILPKSEFDAIVNGDDPARPGDRLHVDITPVDQHGVAFQPGDPANALLLKDPTAGQGEFNFRITHDVDGAEITSGYDDNGCTPVLLVPWEGHTIDSDEKWNVNYQAQFNGDGREVIQAPPLPTIRVQA